MTFDDITLADAVRIRDVLKQLADKENIDAQKVQDDRRAVVISWWDTVKPSIPTTRDEALTAYRFIESLLSTETDRDRINLLRQKLNLANEKFKERKRNG